jgi:transcriptional regulator of acetoin/glycerol metabolism
MSSIAREAAIAYHWPGNVRELRNRIDRAVALADGDLIMPGDLFPGQPSINPAPPALGEVRQSAEKREIEKALTEADWNVSEAARRLRVSRTTLWDKMRRFGIHGPRSLHAREFP